MLMRTSPFTSQKVNESRLKKMWMSGVRNIPSIQPGFTLIELLLVIAIIGTLVTISYPVYLDYGDRKDLTLARADIVGIVNCIERFFTANGRYPVDLKEGGCERDDPWGNPYEYLNISTVIGKGKLRKDKNLNPINTFFDLYSKGKDGRSVSPLTAKHSRDDIILANDGRFIGLATEF